MKRRKSSRGSANWKHHKGLLSMAIYRAMFNDKFCKQTIWQKIHHEEMKITTVKCSSYIYIQKDMQKWSNFFSQKKKILLIDTKWNERPLKGLRVIQVPTFLRGNKEFTVIPWNPEDQRISLRSLPNLGFICPWLLVFRMITFLPQKQGKLDPPSSLWGLLAWIPTSSLWSPIEILFGVVFSPSKQFCGQHIAPAISNLLEYSWEHNLVLHAAAYHLIRAEE